MDDERWGEILDLIQDRYELLDREQRTLDPGPGDEDRVTFLGPGGTKMLLVRTSKPVVLEKRVHSSRRIGSETSEEYIYSNTEQTHTLAAFRWEDATGAWLPLDAPLFTS